MKVANLDSNADRLPKKLPGPEGLDCKLKVLSFTQIYILVNYLLGLLKNYKKGTLKYRVVRNALIVNMSEVEDMDLLNIAEDLDVSIYTVKKVLKEQDP